MPTHTSFPPLFLPPRLPHSITFKEKLKPFTLTNQVLSFTKSMMTLFVLRGCRCVMKEKVSFSRKESKVPTYLTLSDFLTQFQIGP